MKKFALIAVAFASSLFASASTALEPVDHISVSKDQIIVISDGIFIACDGMLLKASALFHTDTGFIAAVARESTTFDRRGRQDRNDPCPGCRQPRTDKHCKTLGCPFYKLD